MNKREHTKRAPTAEIIKGLNDGIGNADVVRAEGLEELKDVLNAKVNQYEREYKRLSKKLGDKHPRVLALTEKIEFHTGFAEVVGKHAIRARIETPAADEKSWILHGRVIDEAEKALPGLIISLVDAKNKPIEIAGTSTTDKEGIFKLKITAEKTAAGKEKLSAANIREGVYISVSDKRQTLIQIDDQAFSPAAGVIDYREIIIEEDLSLCAPEKVKRDKPEEKQPEIKATEKRNDERKGPLKPVKAPTVTKRPVKPTKPK